MADGLRGTIGYQCTRGIEGEAEVTLDADARHASSAGRVHGGVLATLLDAAGGYAAQGAAAADAASTVVTVSMNVTYLASARLPCRLVTRARVVRAAASLTFVDGSVTDGEGRELARATAIYRRP